MVKIYTNENVPKFLAEKLRFFGHDVLTIHDTGLSNKRIPDIQVLEFACKEQRVILTFNKVDFSILHKRMPKHFGIILVTVDDDLDGLATQIDNILKKTDNINGKLIRVHH